MYCRVPMISPTWDNGKAHEFHPCWTTAILHKSALQNLSTKNSMKYKLHILQWLPTQHSSKILWDHYIMVKITLTTPLLDTSLHTPIVPHKSSRFIQMSETNSNSLKNIEALPTFSTDFLPGKMRAYPFRMGRRRGWTKQNRSSVCNLLLLNNFKKIQWQIPT